MPVGIALDGVSFAYPSDPDEDVLRDVTLRLEPGRSLGLVGRTGSGKTTIARLLLRLYDPPTGAVVLGGVDLRDATAASMRRRVRLVTQDVQLFAADLRDNLTLFARDVADERLVK
jgi:ABC-type multidrug transport system fused ATPase/permease subunit